MKSFLMIILKSQKPTTLTAKQFKVISLESLTSVRRNICCKVKRIWFLVRRSWQQLTRTTLWSFACSMNKSLCYRFCNWIICGVKLVSSDSKLLLVQKIHKHVKNKNVYLVTATRLIFYENLFYEILRSHLIVLKNFYMNNKHCRLIKFTSRLHSLSKLLQSSKNYLQNLTTYLTWFVSSTIVERKTLSHSRVSLLLTFTQERNVGDKVRRIYWPCIQMFQLRRF